MKDKVLRWVKKYKWPLFIVINMLPFALNITMYRFGAGLEIVAFLPVFSMLTSLNYDFFDKTLHYVIIQFYLLVCIFCSGYISTYLYYNNISSDHMTKGIGTGLAFLGTIIAIITTIVTGIIKEKSHRQEL